MSAADVPVLPACECPTWCCKPHTVGQFMADESWLHMGEVLREPWAEVSVESWQDVRIGNGGPWVYAWSKGEDMTPKKARKFAAALVKAAAMVEETTR